MLAFSITSNKEWQRIRSIGATAMRRRGRRRFLEQLRLSSAYRIVWAKKVESGKGGEGKRRLRRLTNQPAKQPAHPPTEPSSQPGRRRRRRWSDGSSAGWKSKSSCSLLRQLHHQQQQQVRRQPLVCCGSYPVPPCTRPILKASEEAIMICLFRGFKPG